MPDELLFSHRATAISPGHYVVFTGGALASNTGVYEIGAPSPAGGFLARKVSRFVRLFASGPAGATVALALGRVEAAMWWARRQVAEAMGG